MTALELRALINKCFDEGLPEPTIRQFTVRIDSHSGRPTRTVPCSSKVVRNLPDVLRHIMDVGIGEPPKPSTDLQIKHGSGLIGDINKSLTLAARSRVQAANGPEWSVPDQQKYTEAWASVENKEVYDRIANSRANLFVSAAGLKTYVLQVYKENKVVIQGWFAEKMEERKEEMESVVTKADL